MEKSRGRGIWAVAFEMRVTLGNLLTIAGGLAVAAVMLLTLRVANVECALAVTGISPTTTPCVKGPHRAAVSP